MVFIRIRHRRTAERSLLNIDAGKRSPPPLTEMLFNSYPFILVFLPAALVLFHALHSARYVRSALFSLVLMSLLFSGGRPPIYLLLLAPMTLANFGLARLILRLGGRRSPGAKRLLVLGIAGNLAVLGYFKYANFFIDNFNALSGGDLHPARIILPLGISFFTFQKIAFLVDAYRGEIGRLNLLDFAFYVCFFLLLFVVLFL